jgi:YesN/AraC family two-component response regulator
MNEEKEIPYFQSRRLLNKDFPFKIFRYSSQLLKQTLHTHDYVQIAYVLKGMCNHTMLGKSLTVSRGDLFIITPGTGHSFSAIEAKEFELLLIDFAPDLLDRQFGPLEDLLKPYLAPGPHPVAHSWLHIGKNRQPLLVQLLQEMQDEIESKEIGYEYSIRLTLIKLLMVVEREYRRMERKPDRQSMASSLQPIEEVRRYIHDNYSQDIPLEHGAYIANMAPAYFSHVFKKVTGQSFIDYVNEVRIERAMELINRRLLTITQIGFQVGYRHLGHFIRTFKKRTGMTPTEYKKTFGSAFQTHEERGKNQ